MQTCSHCGNFCPDDVVQCLRCHGRLTGHTGLGRADATIDLEEQAPPDLTGQCLQGRYQVTRKLGAGGMGTVYAADDTRLSRQVALKVLAPELVAHPTARARMAQEARALARIEHPNVVRVFDVFDDAQLLVLVLELMGGGDLAARMRDRQVSNTTTAVALIDAVLAGLEAIHSAGLVHRDVKPENILLNRQGVPKITDLGVARDVQSVQRTQLGARLGTPAYMSPEQAQGLAVDARSDLYSTALVFFEMLSGRLPFAGTSEFDLLAARVQREPDLSGLPPAALAYAPFLVKALARDPAHRFAGAAEMRDMLANPSRLVPGPVQGQAPTIHAEQGRTQAPVRPVAVAEWMTELQRFEGLRQQGILTDAEFAEQKRRLLGQRPGPWAPPQAGSPAASMAEGAAYQAMTPTDILFSFEGRIPRSTYWAYGMLLGFVGAALMIAGEVLLGHDAGLVVAGLALVAAIWPGLAIYVKRCHDRDKSGWWLLILLIPYLGSLVIFVSLGLMEGTRGPNRFGPDPLGRR